MHRVRIGIIGLASVFLLVVLAAALYSLFGEPRPVGPGNASAAIVNQSDAPREPLAELGVTPGAIQGDGNSAAQAALAPAPSSGSPPPRH